MTNFPNDTKKKNADVHDGRDVAKKSLRGRGRADGRSGEQDSIERARVGGERGESVFSRRRRWCVESVMTVEVERIKQKTQLTQVK